MLMVNIYNCAKFNYEHGKSIKTHAKIVIKYDKIHYNPLNLYLCIKTKGVFF